MLVVSVLCGITTMKAAQYKALLTSTALLHTEVLSELHYTINLTLNFKP